MPPPAAADHRAGGGLFLTGKRGYDEVFVNRHYDDFQWPSLDEVERRWEKDESVVEPGGTHQELCEFIVSADIETVLIYTFFSNARFPQSSPSQGWEASTVYDIIG